VCYAPPVSAAASPTRPEPARAPETVQRPRHTALVRVTHWITVLCFFALLITGAEIVVSHPRFYLGEVGNVNTHPLFTLPIPASRDTVPTGYHYVMPDQNGWSRYLHFEAAWALLLTAAVYGIFGVATGHFRRNLWPRRGERSWAAIRRTVAKTFRRLPSEASEAHTYNVLQRSAYLTVIFVLFPLVIWTGLAMSPAFSAALPESVILLGGRQTARTLHFFISGLLLLFLVVHVTMIALAGFRSRMRAMITGQVDSDNLGSAEAGSGSAAEVGAAAEVEVGEHA
jgi:thiosulfate reductase cytochrome b subunit